MVATGEIRRAKNQFWRTGCSVRSNFKAFARVEIRHAAQGNCGTAAVPYGDFGFGLRAGKSLLIVGVCGSRLEIQKCRKGGEQIRARRSRRSRGVDGNLSRRNRSPRQSADQTVFFVEKWDLIWKISAEARWLENARCTSESIQKNVVEHGVVRDGKLGSEICRSKI